MPKPRSSLIAVRSLAAAAAGLSLAPGFTFAADSGPAATTELGLIAVQETEDTGYVAPTTRSATKTNADLRDVPQSVTVITQQQLQDQQTLSIGDLVRYTPGVTAHQGENNRDEIIFRGVGSSSSFFIDGVRDDVQYYRDLYNADRVEILKGPNAMIFGRGGGGGVLNRVTKEAGFTPLQAFSVVGGSYDDRRATVDLNQPLNNVFAVRLNGVYEQSDTFRVDDLKRYGVNPTLTYRPDERTRVLLSYENFHDYRTADRGVPAYAGRPVDADVHTFFGDPSQSDTRAVVNKGALTIEHQFASFAVRNLTSYGNYDRGYQNFVPGAVNAAKTLVALTAYNNATERKNFFNQTDFTFNLQSGAIQHQFLAGLELGRQSTDNFRNTGFFNNTATSISIPYANPTISVPITFRQSATDANNHLRTELGAAYVQDQLVLSEQWQLIAGIRFDRFNLEYQDNRTPTNFERSDNLWSPRAGVIFKPVTSLSLYSSYSISWLPSSGDQFSALTVVTDQAKPEKFTNYEVGAKWDLLDNLQLTSAVYRLDRTNTRSTDPLNPLAVIQVGASRTDGFEAGLTGNVTSAWKIAAAYAYQDGSVIHAYNSNATTTIRAGQSLAQVPRNNISLWNTYQIVPQFGVGVGVIYRSDMYAAIDNTVTLPAYTRVDAAAYYTLNNHLRLQANVENVLDRKYYLNADGNNTSPGSPTAFRVGLNASF
jgi:catecholate siderophore receptor